MIVLLPDYLDKEIILTPVRGERQAESVCVSH